MTIMYHHELKIGIRKLVEAFFDDCDKMPYEDDVKRNEIAKKLNLLKRKKQIIKAIDEYTHL